MKIYILCTLCLFTIACYSQQILSVDSCIKRGKQNIKVKIASQQIEVVKKQTELLKRKYRPVAYISYDYRYNAIIPSQVLPAGLLSSNPSSDKTAIRFGTAWQQNLGLNTSYALLDPATKNSIAENKLTQRIKENSKAQALQEVENRIMRAYSSIARIQSFIIQAEIDTLRTHLALQIIRAKFVEGKATVINVNEAIINHNNNLLELNRNYSLLIPTIVELSSLTDYRIDDLINKKFVDVIVLEESKLGILFDSLPDFRAFRLERELLIQKIKSVKDKAIPTLSFQGFLGANQFTNNFNPVESGSWFGNSFVGIQAKIPILGDEDKRMKVKFINSEIDVNRLQETELKLIRENDLARVQLLINDKKNSLIIVNRNKLLAQENYDLLLEQFKLDKTTGAKLLEAEVDIQSRSQIVYTLQAELIELLVEKKILLRY